MLLHNIDFDDSLSILINSLEPPITIGFICRSENSGLLFSSSKIFTANSISTSQPRESFPISNRSFNILTKGNIDHFNMGVKVMTLVPF